MFNSFNPDCGGFIQHFCTHDEPSSNFYYNGYGQYTRQDPFGYASINGYTQPTGDDSRRNPMFQESMNNVQGYAQQAPPQNVGYGDGYPQQNNGYGSYFNNDDHFYSSNYDLPGNNNQPTFQQNKDSFDWASISNGASAFNDNNSNNDMFGYNMDAAVKQMNVDDPFAKGVSQFERQRNSTWDTPLDKTNPMMPPSPSCFGCPKVNEQTWNNQEALAKANEQSSIMDKVNKSFEMNGRLTRDEDWLNVLKK